MNEPSYPDLDTICRLCLKKSGDGFQIFSTDETQLSIPMRIMTLSLDVKEKDGLPKQICTDCRYELEKSFLFRKRSQLADNKLRKHIRLLSLGKKSRVFCKDDEDDFDEDELEFEDSVRFLEEQDELKNKHKEQWKEEYKEKLQANFQKDLEESKAEIRKECCESLRLELKNEVRQELRAEVCDEVKEELRTEVANEVRGSLRKELKEECRKEQIGELISELEDFLHAKKSTDKRIVKNGSTAEAAKKVQKITNKPSKARAGTTTSRAGLTAENNKSESLDSGEDAEDDDVEVYQALSSDGTVDDLKADAELENTDENVDDYSLVADNKVYIINENIDELTKRPKVNDSATPIDISQVLAGSFNYDADAGNGKNITSYKIEDNGEIQFCRKRSRGSINRDIEHDSTSSSVIMLNIDDEMVEFINVDEKGNLLKNKKRRANAQEKKEVKEKLDKSNAKEIINEEDTNANENRLILRRHTETVKTFYCKLCPIVFSTEKSLTRHMRSHGRVLANGIHYQCPTCKLYLSCSSALKRHMVVHTGERPYACAECGKTFAQREILKRHMDTHIGIKPFECPHCKQCFSQKTNLKTHISKLHLDAPKQHSCHLCNKQYTHASGLSRHLTTHTGLMYECKQCQRRFHDRSSVKRHVIGMHKVTDWSEDAYIAVK